MTATIHSFTGLKAWQEAHGLVVKIYEMTKGFPREEQFGLTNQIRRASVSISSNLAEGFSKKSKKEKTQFYSTALASLTEVQNQMLIARDVGYIANELFQKHAQQTVTVSKLINGLMKTVQDRP